jgi:hypothetical protein
MNAQCTPPVIAFRCLAFLTLQSAADFISFSKALPLYREPTLLRHFRVLSTSFLRHDYVPVTLLLMTSIAANRIIASACSTYSIYYSHELDSQRFVTAPVFVVTLENNYNRNMSYYTNGSKAHMILQKIHNGS